MKRARNVILAAGEAGQPWILLYPSWGSSWTFPPRAEKNGQVPGLRVVKLLPRKHKNAATPRDTATPVFTIIRAIFCSSLTVERGAARVLLVSSRPPPILLGPRHGRAGSVQLSPQPGRGTERS